MPQSLTLQYQSTRATFFLQVLLALLLCANARPDSWVKPRPKVFVSLSGDSIVRIEPARRDDTPNPQACRALVFAFDATASDYALTKELTLANPVAPVEVVISDDGRFLVTFDDYYSAGYGDNVIVIYDLLSSTKTHLKLEDFLTTAQIEGFDRSTSSRHWRGGVSFMQDQRSVYIGWAESSFDDTKLLPSFILDVEAKKVSIDQRVAQQRAQQNKQKSKKAWWQFWR